MYVGMASVRGGGGQFTSVEQCSKLRNTGESGTGAWQVRRGLMA